MSNPCFPLLGKSLFVILPVGINRKKGDFVVKNRNKKTKRYWGFIDFEFQSAIGNRRADLISIGLIVYDTKEKRFVDEYYSLIKPTKPITKKVSKLTGLTNETLKDAKEWKDLSKSVEVFLKNYKKDIYIYAYSDNDARTVEQVCRKYRIKNIFKGEFKIRDASVIIVRRMRVLGHPLFEVLPSLSRLADFYDIEFKNKHNALEDAKILALVYQNTMAGIYHKKQVLLPFLKENISVFIKDLEWNGSVFNTLSLNKDNVFELSVWQGSFKHRLEIKKENRVYAVLNDIAFKELSTNKRQLVNHVLILIAIDESELTKLLPF